MASEMFITDIKAMQAAIDAAVNGTPINYTGVTPCPKDRSEAEEWQKARDAEHKLKVQNLIAAIELGML